MALPLTSKPLEEFTPLEKLLDLLFFESYETLFEKREEKGISLLEFKNGQKKIEETYYILVDNPAINVIDGIKMLLTVVENLNLGIEYEATDNGIMMKPIFRQAFVVVHNNEYPINNFKYKFARKG